MKDIESEITGKTVEDNLLESNFSVPDALRVPLIQNGEQELNQQEIEYAKQKRLETKTNWLRQEGTTDFITQLKGFREDKLIEAENLAKQGLNENAIRLLIKCGTIRETIEIIKEI